MVTQYAELAAMDVVDNNSCNCLACKVLMRFAFVPSACSALLGRRCEYQHMVTILQHQHIQVLILPGDAKFENFRQAFVLKFRETLQKMQLEPTWYACCRCWLEIVFLYDGK